MEIDVRQFSSDKILKHLDRVNAWLKGENPSPITVELDMTNLCNHRCPECSGWYFQNRDASSLPLDLAKDIIRQLAEQGIRGLIFTGGGEPLCHPGIKEAVRVASDAGLDIGFITNGSLINEKIAEVLLGCCTWLRVSLDAASADIFQKVHGLGVGEFNKVVDNIRLLARLKKSMGSQTTIGIGYLTTDFTKNEMLDMTNLVKQLCIDYLQFRPMQLHKNNKFSYHRDQIKKEIFRCIKQAGNGCRVLYSRHKYDMMEEENYGQNYQSCYGHQFASVVAADGKMYVCCHMRGNHKYCIGDLKKNNFSEIWSSQQRHSTVANIDFRDCVPLCRDNTFNQILWNIKQPKEHVNFL